MVKEFDEKLSRFYTKHTCNTQRDRQTHRHTEGIATATPALA